MSETDVQLQGAVLHVNNLAKAIDFYTRLLDFEVARQTLDGALLTSPAGISTIALRERRVQHFTDRTVEALVWRVPTLGALRQIEQRLHRLNSKAVKRNVNEEALTLLIAWDPDGQRLVFIHHDDMADVPRDIPGEVFWY